MVAYLDDLAARTNPRTAKPLAVATSPTTRCCGVANWSPCGWRTSRSKLTAPGRYLARSKTHQEGQGSYCWLASDTVGRLRAWKEARADALAAETKRGRTALTDLAAALREGRVVNGARRRQALERALARLEGASDALWLQVGQGGAVLGPLAARGPDPALVSGHSLRVGAAKDLTAAGFGLPAIQQAGRWKSPSMPARYAEKIVPKQGAMAQLAGKQGRG